MKSDIGKRLLRMEEIMRLQMEEQRRHEPFVVIRPWSMFRDDIEIDYYPEGIFKGYECYLNKTLDEVIEFIGTLEDKIDISISYLYCVEWLHIHFQNRETLTDEQKESFREKDFVQYPELSLLYEEENRRYWNMIANFPQQARLNREVLKNERSGKTVKTSGTGH